MASVTRDPKGYRILFVDQTGKRRNLRPGKVDKATAQQISRHCEALVASLAAGSVIPRQTALWLSEINDRLHTKLANAGLVEPRANEAGESPMALVDFIDTFIDDGKTAAGRKASESTVKKWITARNHLQSFFGADKLLAELTPSDAQQFRKSLEQRTIASTGQQMRENSKRKIIASTKVILNRAVQLELIERNPFKHEASSTLAARDRDYFVTSEMTQILLAAAPDAQWRLIIALWRLAGLRKMEIHSVYWRDILRDSGRFRVQSTKTAHIEGRGVRYVPLSPVLPFLEDAWQAALPPGLHSLPADSPVITRYSPTNVNLHKPFEKIIRAAGLAPWPKLIQNLRSSCETEWLDSGMPAHVVANWIGHTVQVQNESYAQVDDHHFDRFNKLQGSKVAHIVAHIVAQYHGAQSGKEMQADAQMDGKTEPFTVRAQKKHGFETVLNAPERSRTSTSITDT